jgi:radical SAM-linked protein
MASDLPATEPPGAAVSPARACDKVRIRFRKGGDLRLVSHRDLMRCFERGLRRARLPIHVTQGFHPLPRMVFAMALGLGIAGLDEVLELEFNQPLEPEDVHRRLAEQMPPGLEILQVRRIPVASAAQVTRTGYRLAVPPQREPEVQERIAALLAASECIVQRQRPTPRRFDLRSCLAELRLCGGRLEMLLFVSPHGTARPSEVLEVLGLHDLVEEGVPLERHLLEIHDEINQSGPQSRQEGLQ